MKFPTNTLIKKFTDCCCDKESAERLSDIVVNNLDDSFNNNIEFINPVNSVQDLADMIYDDYEMRLCNLLDSGNVITVSRAEVYTQGDVDYITITGCLTKEFMCQYIEGVLKILLSE